MGRVVRRLRYKRVFIHDQTVTEGEDQLRLSRSLSLTNSVNVSQLTMKMVQKTGSCLCQLGLNTKDLFKKMCTVKLPRLSIQDIPRKKS